MIAEGCYQSHEYHRALMYLEQHMASSGKGLSETTEGGLLAVTKLLHFFKSKELQVTRDNLYIFYYRKYMLNLMSQMEFLVF